MIDVIFDMETGDPDDLFTLFLLCDHPYVNLKAVTITPGASDQVALVEWALRQFNKDIQVGVWKNCVDKKCVSSWYYNTYKPSVKVGRSIGKSGNIFERPDGGQIIANQSDENTVLITGAPLKNLDLAMDLDFKAKSWFAQGGFAGEGVVPEHLQLEKFKGMRTCPTFNLNGAPKTSLRALEYNLIPEKYFISKNVCHGVYYNQDMHDIVESKKDTKLSLKLIHQGMSVYLRKHPNGKKFHDPLAACCAINPSIGVWCDVEIYREKGQWGSKLSEKPNAKIIIDYDKEKFIETMLRV